MEPVHGSGNPADPEGVREEVRAFSAPIRWPLNRLILSETRKDRETWRNLRKRDGQHLFRLNSRYADDGSCEQAEGVLRRRAGRALRKHNGTCGRWVTDGAKAREGT